MTTTVTKPNGTPQTQPVNNIRRWLNSDDLKTQLAQVLPKHLSADRQARVALTALTRTPKLADCDPASFFQCLLTLSQFGLEPDGRLAHLIPFNNTKRGVIECTLILDYKGLVELAMRSGKVANIHADLLCENDEVDYDRGMLLKHRIDFRKPRGPAYAAYALVRFKDGTEKCEVLGREEIESIRKRSRAGNTGPWVTDWAEMAKKTAFRRLSKWISLSAEFRDAVAADDDDLIETTATSISHAALESAWPETQVIDDQTGEESQEAAKEETPSLPPEGSVAWWLVRIGECKDAAALARRHETFDGVRADKTPEDQDAIEGAFATRLQLFTKESK